MSAIHLPDRPLERFVALARAIAKRRRWYQDQTVLYFAGSAALTVEGQPDELVGRLWARAEELKRASRWTSPLRQDIRFVLAAPLLRSGIDTKTFLRETDAGRELFRAARLPQRNSAHALVALLLCLQHASTRHVDRSQVDKLANIYTGFRADHAFLTGADDLPAAALLASTDVATGEILTRVEAMYRALREARFGASGQLQKASQLLFFAPGGPTETARRFRALWDAFKSAGLYMHQGDHDELALLCFLERSASALVQHVLTHRDTILDLRPRPSRDNAFSLACSTTFLELAPKERSARGLTEAHAMLQVQGVLQAQQAAAVAAAGGAAAAAG